MRRGTTAAILVAAAVVAGCGSMGKRLGFTDEADKDWSAMNSRAGGNLDLDAPQVVALQKFEPALAGPAPSVKVVLKNEGDTYDIFSVDVEFGFKAPADSFAEYNPEFVSIDFPEFKKGEVRETVVKAPAGLADAYFVRMSTSRGKEVRMTTGREESAKGVRHGSVLLQGKVEVVEVGGDLAGEKPSLTFTLESLDAKAVGDLRYTVQFNKDGKFLDLGRRLSGLRPVGEPLGEKGRQVVVKVTGLENAGVSLAGAKPVLRLVAAQ